MKKVFSSILSVIALCGACFLSGNFASATEGSEAEKAAAERVAAAAAPTVSARDTELVFIVDKSGSMSRIADDTIANFNRVLDEQKVDTEHGRAFVTTVMFNNRHKKIHDREDVQAVRHITKSDYRASGGTALMDAIGSTISDLSKKFATENEVVGHKVVVVIVTDGYENASKKYDRSQIRKLIREKKAEGWEFVFYGANIDVEKESDRMGIGAGHSLGFVPTSAGVNHMFSHVSSSLSLSRAMPSKPDSSGK